MKTSVLFFSIFLLAFSGSTAQQAPVKKLHGYHQLVIEGKKPAPGEHPKSTDHYFIYAELKKGTLVKFNGLWINSNYYQIKTKRTVKLPVTQTAPGQDNKVLVAKTANDVYEIILSKKQDPSPRPGAALGKHLSTNEVVLVYTYKGKQYFATVSKLEELESMPMM